MITAQVHPGEVAIINCPNESCNYELMERAGPYIFLTSFEGLKTLRDLNVGGLLESEALHFDFQPSRVSKYTCFAAYAYDLDLRSMAPLFSAILTKETEASVYVILELVRHLLRDRLDCDFNPAMYMADEAAALKNAVIREHGVEKLKSYGTCELHYMKSAFQHCSSAIGSQQKQFEHLKFAESLLNAMSPEVYNELYKAYRIWIEERRERREALGTDWIGGMSDGMDGAMLSEIQICLGLTSKIWADKSFT